MLRVRLVLHLGCVLLLLHAVCALCSVRSARLADVMALQLKYTPMQLQQRLQPAMSDNIR